MRLKVMVDQHVFAKPCKKPIILQLFVFVSQNVHFSQVIIAVHPFSDLWMTDGYLQVGSRQLVFQSSPHAYPRSQKINNISVGDK